jgi:hypothetical protein
MRHRCALGLRLGPDQESQRSPVTEVPWYTMLRESYRPDVVRVLLVGEAAPDPGDGERRFFYAPVLHQRDNLFRGVVEGFYGCSPGHAGDRKAPWLERLVSDGAYLIDLVPFPVDNMSPDKAKARRLRWDALRDHVDARIEEAIALEPAGIIICHDGVYRAAAVKMRAAGLRVLHDKSIPFPLYAGRKVFPVKVRAAIARLD